MMSEQGFKISNLKGMMLDLPGKLHSMLYNLTLMAVHSHNYKDCTNNLYPNAPTVIQVGWMDPPPSGFRSVKTQ